MKQSLQEIPLNQIHAKENYRKTFREKSITELASSIKENGVLEPIIVRPNNKGYEIVAGERRYRASLVAGLVTIPAVIRDIADADITKLQIIENVQREGVPYMEEADAIKKLRDECALDAKEIAKMVGKSEAYVYLMLQLCNLTGDARRMAEKGWLSRSVAWLIARLPNEDYQTQAAHDLGREHKDKLIGEKMARKYIDETFGEKKYKRRRPMAIRKVSANDYQANWKFYLVRFGTEQFEAWKKIVHGRTDTAILSDAVDVVMRGAE